MAVTARTPVGHNSTGATTSETFSYTCTSGDRMLIAVGVYSTDGSVAPSSVTYAGDGLTKIADQVYGDPNLRLTLWKLDSPQSGANNVVITTSKEVNEINAVVRCYGGSSGFGTPVAVTNNSQTSISATVTGTTSGSVISDFLDLWATASGAGFAPNAGQTSRFEQNNLGGNQSQFSSDETSSGGDVGMGWSWTTPNDQDTGLIAVEVFDVGGDTTAPNLSLPAATSITVSSVVLGATTDEGNGIAHAIIVPDGEESIPTNQEVIDGNYGNQVAVASDLTINATGAFTFTSTGGLSANTTYGYAIVHEDVAGNEDAGSRVEGTFTTSASGQTYSQVIDSFGPVHRYTFDGDATDSVGTADGTNSGCIFTDSAICEEVTNCATTNGTGDRITLPSVADINNSAQNRKAVCGWFMTTAIQDPPKRIYGEGNETQSFAIIMGWGNNVIFEVDSADFTLQIFTDVPLEPNRAYHLCAILEGNGYGNEWRAYLDGVKQLSAEPASRRPDTATLSARSAGEFGDPAGTVSVGGTTVLLNAPVNGQYSQWAFFDGANAVLTDAEVREKLFEAGALPDATISAGTQSEMQTSLDALASTLRANAPLCIRVEQVTGNGDVRLVADSITFDSLASIHVQYKGTGTLTWVNDNGGNASISSTPNGGTVVFENPATLTVNGLINGCEFRIYDDELSDPLNFDTELAGVETLTGTSFTYDHAGISNTVVLQMIADGYEEIIQRVTLTAVDQTVTLLPVVEENI